MCLAGINMNERTLAGHEALSADIRDLESQLNKERELLKVVLHLLNRCREQGMPYYLRSEIDSALVAGKDYL